MGYVRFAHYPLGTDSFIQGQVELVTCCPLVAGEKPLDSGLVIALAHTAVQRLHLHRVHDYPGDHDQSCERQHVDLCQHHLHLECRLWREHLLPLGRHNARRA